MKYILISFLLLVWEIVWTLGFFMYLLMGCIIRFILVISVVPIWVLFYSLAWVVFWFFDSSVPPLWFMLRYRSIFETRPAQLWMFIKHG